MKGTEQTKDELLNLMLCCCPSGKLSVSFKEKKAAVFPMLKNQYKNVGTGSESLCVRLLAFEEFVLQNLAETFFLIFFLFQQGLVHHLNFIKTENS